MSCGCLLLKPSVLSRAENCREVRGYRRIKQEAPDHESQACPTCHKIETEEAPLAPNITRNRPSRSYEYLKNSISTLHPMFPRIIQTITIRHSRGGNGFRDLRVNETRYHSAALRDQRLASFDHKKPLQRRKRRIEKASLILSINLIIRASRPACYLSSWPVTQTARYGAKKKSDEHETAPLLLVVVLTCRITEPM